MKSHFQTNQSLSFAGFFCIVLANCSLVHSNVASQPFRVFPYLQNPDTDSISICWFSNSNEPGKLTVFTPDGPWEATSKPLEASALAYNPFREEPDGPHPVLPYKHRLRVTGLTPDSQYRYTVLQGDRTYSGVFRTAPDSETSIRFILYSDSETEPESTNSHVDWPASVGSDRPPQITKYVVDQTTGYRENLKVIDSRKPNFISIVGDLAEAGGEQRDWDEFWKHNSGDYGKIGDHIPIFAALGNHENYGGPGGGYSAAAANFATEKFLTYFEVPSNQGSNPRHHGRYYSLRYGPITLITLDSSDGLPDQTVYDTNHSLNGSHAPDFNPQSEQFRWFQEQLFEAQKTSRFTFVQFHHTMYGSGPHSVPFGNPGFSGQSGIAMRVIEPLLFKYGVDAVFSGHDEMFERSQKTGVEVLPNGQTKKHSIQFFDVGVGGDGLRGPSIDFDNPYRKFLAHEHAPEKWNGSQLVSGGKHYGHLEVNVTRNLLGQWQAILTPVYVFPLMNRSGQVVGWERRTYDDTVTIGEAFDKTNAQNPTSMEQSDSVRAALVLVFLSGISCLIGRRRQLFSWNTRTDPV